MFCVFYVLTNSKHKSDLYASINACLTTLTVKLNVALK